MDGARALLVGSSTALVLHAQCYVPSSGISEKIFFLFFSSQVQITPKAIILRHQGGAGKKLNVALGTPDPFSPIPGHNAIALSTHEYCYQV